MNWGRIPISMTTFEFTSNRLLVSDSTASIRPSIVSVIELAIFDLPEHATTSHRGMEPPVPATRTMAILYTDESMALSHIPHQPGA